MKVYLVMAWNYPDRIFDSLDKAIEYCQKTDHKNFCIDEYEVNGKQVGSTSVWAKHWHGRGEEYMKRFS